MSSHNDCLARQTFAMRDVSVCLGPGRCRGTYKFRDNCPRQHPLVGGAPLGGFRGTALPPRPAGGQACQRLGGRLVEVMRRQCVRRPPATPRSSPQSAIAATSPMMPSTRCATGLRNSGAPSPDGSRSGSTASKLATGARTRGRLPREAARTAGSGPKRQIRLPRTQADQRMRSSLPRKRSYSASRAAAEPWRPSLRSRRAPKPRSG